MMPLSDFKMPETDEEAKAYLENHVKSLCHPKEWEPITMGCTKGIYQCQRAQGASIADSLIAAPKTLAGVTA